MKPSFLFFLIIFNTLLINVLHAQENTVEPKKWETTLEDYGDVMEFAIPISTGLITLLKKDYKGSKQFAFSYGSTMLTAYLLKAIVKKDRPEGVSQKQNSFPSGHTASAFGGAAFLQRRYGFKYGIPAFALAGLVGVSRVEGTVQHHDYLDVLASAAIAIGYTFIFVKPQSENQIELGLNTGNGNYVLAFSYKF